MTHMMALSREGASRRCRIMGIVALLLVPLWLSGCRVGDQSRPPPGDVRASTWVCQLAASPDNRWLVVADRIDTGRPAGINPWAISVIDVADHRLLRRYTRPGWRLGGSISWGVDGHSVLIPVNLIRHILPSISELLSLDTETRAVSSVYRSDRLILRGEDAPSGRALLVGQLGGAAGGSPASVGVYLATRSVKPTPTKLSTGNFSAFLVAVIADDNPGGYSVYYKGLRHGPESLSRSHGSREAYGRWMSREVPQSSCSPGRTTWSVTVCRPKGSGSQRSYALTASASQDSCLTGGQGFRRIERWWCPQG